jgi:hypothetical protein
MKSIHQLSKFAFILGLIVSIAATKPAAVKISFDGSWKLDTAKSDFGGVPKERAAPVLINLLQDKSSITFDRKFQNIPSIPKETLTLDGKEIEIKQDEFTAVRTLQLSDDNLRLTVNSKYHMTPEGQEAWDYTRTETYALARDGKSMQLTRISVTPGGTDSVRAHYNRIK